MMPDELRRLAQQVQRALEAAVRARVENVRQAQAPELARELRVLEDYLIRPGKRLRGILALLGARAAGDDRGALDAALAVELFHLHLIALDDIMDADRERRGGPALHAALAALHGDEHAGASLAITFANVARAWALSLVAAAPDAERARRALMRWASLEAEVNAGQALDVARLGSAPDLEALLARIRALKTGSYSFALPLSLGWILGGGTDPHPFGAYCTHAGDAFQIADDVLGAFGDPAVTGKPAGRDLAERRPSAVLAAARALDPEATEAYLAGPRDAAATARFLDRLRALGVPERCREEARAAATRAREALAALDLPAGVRSLLDAVVLLCADRSA